MRIENWKVLREHRFDLTAQLRFSLVEQGRRLVPDPERTSWLRWGIVRFEILDIFRPSQALRTQVPLALVTLSVVPDTVQPVELPARNL